MKETGNGIDAEGVDWLAFKETYVAYLGESYLKTKAVIGIVLGVKEASHTI